MSSSVDSGYYAEKARKATESFCPKSKDGKHQFVKHGSWPSTWFECKCCKHTEYSK